MRQLTMPRLPPAVVFTVASCNHTNSAQNVPRNYEQRPDCLRAYERVGGGAHRQCGALALSLQGAGLAVQHERRLVAEDQAAAAAAWHRLLG